VTTQREMMGLDLLAERKVSISMRDWAAVKNALWRSKYGWEAISREAELILERCAHVKGCPGATLESEPCDPGCPDREKRMSALVILAATRAFAPIDVRRPAQEPYFAPTRERYAEVIAALAAAQAELEVVRGTVLTAPPPNEIPRKDSVRSATMTAETAAFLRDTLEAKSEDEPSDIESDKPEEPQ
jgi:hypothetical protein